MTKLTYQIGDAPIAVTLHTPEQSTPRATVVLCHGFCGTQSLLLPAFARHAPADDPDVVRVLVEHVDIRRRFADLAGTAAPDVADLQALGVALRDHVRHEERVLFGRIEQALGAEELATLGVALRHDSASA